MNDRSDKLKEIVALNVIELAQRGVLDPVELTLATLVELRAEQIMARYRLKLEVELDIGNCGKLFLARAELQRSGVVTRRKKEVSWSTLARRACGSLKRCGSLKHLNGFRSAHLTLAT